MFYAASCNPSFPQAVEHYRLRFGVLERMWKDRSKTVVTSRAHRLSDRSSKMGAGW